MKYKDYKNSYTNDNRIYSKNELYDMTLREIYSRKGELEAQYKVLGLPDEKELRNSENVVYVEAYTREDGTEVRAHWRSKPGNGELQRTTDELISDNYAYEKETEDYKAEYKKREKEKSIERKDPDEIAGVKRGEPKTFEEAGGEKVNPHYYDGAEYQNNCQSCAVAYELRIRGYDVIASKYEEGNIAQELAKNPCRAWIDVKTGEVCEGYELDIKQIRCEQYFEEHVKEGERYIFVYGYDREMDGEKEVKRHIRTVDKDPNGKLRVYDVQSGSILTGEDVKNYFETWAGESVNYMPIILRIDNKKINPRFGNFVVCPS